MSRRFWVQPMFVARSEGEFRTLYPILRANSDVARERFSDCLRMKSSTFDYILEGIYSRLYNESSSFRESFSPEEMLYTTLRYLSHGSSYRSLEFNLRLSHQSISRIVEETCQAIWEVYGKTHMTVPNEADYERIASSFLNLWNMPNCCGAIDGKHIRIRSPAQSGSSYYNYKGYFSIVLQGNIH